MNQDQDQSVGVPDAEPSVALSAASPRHGNGSGLSATIANAGHIAHFRSLHFITMWQPWASWVALGWKTIETRTHKQFAWLSGHDIGIHAGLKWDNEAIGLAEKWLTLEQMHMTEELRALRGVVVCTARVRNYGKLTNEHHSRCGLIDCSKTTRYGLFLDNIKPLDPPVFARGQQGVWKFDPQSQPKN